MKRKEMQAMSRAERDPQLIAGKEHQSFRGQELNFAHNLSLEKDSSQILKTRTQPG